MSSLASLWALASRAQISCRPGGRLLLSLPAGLPACSHPPGFTFLWQRGRCAAAAAGSPCPVSSHLGRWSLESRVARDKGACAGLGLALPTLTPKERGSERETQQGCCGRVVGQEKEDVSVPCRTSLIRPALPIKAPGRQEWGGGSESEGASMGVQKPGRCMEKGDPRVIGGLEVG